MLDESKVWTGSINADAGTAIADVGHVGGQAIVCLVGDAIRHTPGVAATIFGALQAINVRMISQGGSRTNVSIVIDERDVPAAIERLTSLGVRILEGIHNFGNTALQSAMIEGPDGLAIELVERTSGTEVSR